MRNETKILSITNANTGRAKALMEVTFFFFFFWHTHDFEMCPNFSQSIKQKSFRVVRSVYAETELRNTGAV